MLRATWKSLLGHKLRMLMSAFAIVLGVAFVSGSLQFTDLLGNSLNGLLKGTIADVNVGQKGEFEGETAGSTPPIEITREMIDEMAAVDGVDRALGLNTATTLYPLDSKGRLLGAMGAPTISSNFIDAPAAGGQEGLVLKSGRLPGDGEVLMDPDAFARSGLEIGDELTVVDAIRGEQVRFPVVGTATWGSGATFGATYLFFDDATSQRLMTDGKDVFRTAWIVTESGADPAKVAAEIQKMLPDTMEALDADTVSETTQEVLNQGLSFVNTFLLVFAAIALVVATFLIVNTFSIIVAQRGRELALLRAMGASRGQVRGSVLIEAVIVGVFGATLGIGLGWLLAWGISSAMVLLGIDLGGTLPGVSLTAVVASYAVGVLVTLGAAYVPAARASRVPPVAAMTGDAMTGKSGLGGRVVIAGVLIVLGVGSLTAGLAGWVPEALTFVGVGALLILLGVAGASPLLGRPVTWLLGRLYRWMFGAVGQLAELNAARNPRRTAATASALMIGLALVVTMAILGQSAKSSVGGIVQTSFKGDLLVSSLMSPLAPRVGDAIAEVEGVDALYRTRRAPAQLKGETVSLIGMTPDTFGKTVDETMVSGSLTDDLDTVIVRDTWASDHDVAEGERIPLEINGLTRNVRVTGIFTAPEQSSAGSAVTNLDTLTEAGVPPLDSSYTVFVADGQDVGQVRERIQDVVSDQPLISVDDIDSITQQATGAIDQLLAVIYALLALAIVIAVLGIVNTLALSVIERTREIGLLRAIGLTRGQLRRMVTLESVVVSVLGAVLGVGMGLVFGLALQRQLAEQGLERLDIPWPLLILFLVVSVLVGVLAAVWPARRAARLDVLQAIATE